MHAIKEQIMFHDGGDEKKYTVTHLRRQVAMVVLKSAHYFYERVSALLVTPPPPQSKLAGKLN